MNDEQRQELIEKREQGTLTAEEYQLYLDLLENDPDFGDQLALHQLLADAARQEADEQLWESIRSSADSEPVSRQPGFWLILLNHPLARRGAFALLFLIAGFVGYRLYQRSIENLTVAAELPVFNVKTREEGSGFGSDDGTPNRVLPVVLARPVADTLDENRAYYVFSTDTLRLYVPNPSLDAIRGWQVRYDAIADKYQLIRPGKPVIPLRLTGSQALPLP